MPMIGHELLINLEFFFLNAQFFFFGTVVLFYMVEHEATLNKRKKVERYLQIPEELS